MWTILGSILLLGLTFLANKCQEERNKKYHLKVDYYIKFVKSIGIFKINELSNEKKIEIQENYNTLLLIAPAEVINKSYLYLNAAVQAKNMNDPNYTKAMSQLYKTMRIDLKFKDNEEVKDGFKPLLLGDNNFKP